MKLASAELDVALAPKTGETVENRSWKRFEANESTDRGVDNQRPEFNHHWAMVVRNSSDAWMQHAATSATVGAGRPTLLVTRVAKPILK